MSEPVSHPVGLTEPEAEAIDAIRHLIRALMFYADPGHYEPDSIVLRFGNGAPAGSTSPIEDDRGRTAREALQRAPLHVAQIDSTFLMEDHDDV